MADGGYLIPPSQDASKERIWIETRRRLERFLPSLFPEIFPEALAQDKSSRPLSMISASSPTTATVLSPHAADREQQQQQQQPKDEDKGPVSESDVGAQKGD